MISPSYFFDLSDFPHAAIFDSILEPWLVIAHIQNYLLSLPLGKIEGKISPQAYLINPEYITIEPGTIVEPGAYIQGPCWIGKNCHVRHGAYIRGNLITGDGCVIGHDTEIKNVLFLNHVHAAHFAYVGDSILGNRVNLGAGTKCANLKLNQQLISLHIEGKRIPTQLKKLGAIIGDGSQIGCNAVLNPGTLVGKEVLCHPCLNIGGMIPTRSIVKSPSNLVISSY